MAKIITISFNEKELEYLKQYAKQNGFNSIQKLLKHSLYFYLDFQKQKQLNQFTQQQTQQNQQQNPEESNEDKELMQLLDRIEATIKK